MATERTVTIALRARTDAFNQQVRQAGGEVQRLDQNVQGFTQRHSAAMTKAGMAAMAFGAGTAFALNKAADATNELNASMANVSTLIPGAGDRVVELKGDVQDLAVEVGKSTADISGGLYQVISAFGDTSDTTQILEINAKAAAAGLATTTDAINLTSAVTKGYGDTTAEAVQKASDLAFTTVRLGQTTFPELAASIGSVVPLAAELNVTQEELFGTMATFTGVTGNASEVATQMTSALTGLLNPSETLTGYLDELGYASGGAMIEALGFEGAIKNIAAEAEESGTPLMKFLGRKEAVVLALAGASGQADVWTDKIGQATEATGASAEAFELQTEGINKWGFSAEQAAVQQEVAMQKLGESIAPVKAVFMGFLGDTAEGFSNLSPEMQAVAAKAGMVTSAVGLLGGAALIATPRLVAMNATLAATGPLGLAASKGISATSSALFGPWGMAAAVGAGAAYSLQKAFFAARDEASALADEIVATSETTEEASARINDALGDHLDEVFSDETRKQERKNFLLGPIGAFFSLRDQIDQAGTALELWGTEVDEAAVGTDGLELSAQRGGAAIETLTASSLLERLRQYRPAADDVAVGIDGMEESTEEAKSAFDELAPSVVAAFEALGSGFDPMATYQEKLQEMNDANREAAEATAEATESQEDSWEQYFTETEASFSAYMSSLDQTLEDQRTWHADINTIREAAGDDYADMLLAQGPENAALHAEIARQEHDVIRTAAAQAQTIRDEATAESIEMLIRSTPEWVSAAGEVSGETVAEIREKLGAAPGVVEEHLKTSRAVMEAQFIAMKREVGPAAAGVVAAMAYELGLGTVEADRIVNAWANATGQNLNPLLQMVGKEPIPLFARKLLAGARHAGGPIDDDPGYRGFTGPPRDDERFILAQTGEHMLSREEVNRLGGHGAVEAIRHAAKRGNIEGECAHDSHTGGGGTGVWKGAIGQEWMGLLRDGRQLSVAASNESQSRWGAAAGVGSWNSADMRVGLGSGAQAQGYMLTTNEPANYGYAYLSKVGDAVRGYARLNERFHNVLSSTARQSVAAHETGHLLGLAHTSGHSLMNTSRDRNLVTGPTASDMQTLRGLFPALTAPSTDGTALPSVTIPPIPSFDPLQYPLSTTAESAVGYARDAAVAWVNEQMAATGAASGGAVPGGAGIGGGIGVSAMMNILRGQFPGLPLISGYRPGAVTATGNPSWHGKNRAVDIPPRMDVFNWLRSNYGSQALELIFSPAGGNQIYRGRNHMFSGVTRKMHWDHIHWAMANGGVINEPVMGIGASGDSYSFGENGPERVTPMTSTASQWTPGGSGGIDYDALGAAVAKHLSGPMSTSTAQIAAAASAMPNVNMDGQKVARITKEHMRRDELAHS